MNVDLEGILVLYDKIYTGQIFDWTYLVSIAKTYFKLEFISAQFFVQFIDLVKKHSLIEHSNFTSE